jgi:Lipoprotein LpqB beta-propeller domain/Sporulation and spore germination
VSRPRGGFAAVLLIALATGCAQIPTSGPVVEGEAVPEQLPVSVGFVPNPPAAGASETAIVQGFLEAMASYEAGYETAKEFLTPDAAPAWEPSAAMTIYSTTPTVTQTARGAVRLTLTVEAVISPEAGYERRAPALATNFDLTLSQVDGEWRIANPPPGLLVFKDDFESEFREYNLYYWDADFEELVPDPVYVPTQGNVPSLLAEALVRGPSRWLAPAVSTAFPNGTTVALPVAVDAGRAQVELSAEAADGTPDQREQMTAQLAWTLDQVDGVQQVVVRADSVPLTDTGSTAGPAESFGELDPNRPRGRDLFALTEAGVVVGDQLTPVAGPLGEFSEARTVAVDPLAGRAAVVDANGTQVLWAPFDSAAEVAVLVTGTDLRSLSWDRTGLVWAVDQVPGGSRVIVATPDGAVSDVPTPQMLVGRDIDDLAVSPDGSRVAMAVEGELMVGIVLRDPTQMTASIEGLRRVQIDGRVGTSVAWSGLTELAILVQRNDEPADPFRVGIGGSVLRPAGPVPDAVDIAAAPGQGLAVSTAEGTLLRQTPTLSWDEIGAALGPAYPG